MSIRKARELRKAMTPPERRLWNVLKQQPEGLKFRRQHEHGPYYLDFYCHEAAVAVEVDGYAHDRLKPAAGRAEGRVACEPWNRDGSSDCYGRER